jgi:DNA-binding IclR family transcriptional regulator
MSQEESSRMVKSVMTAFELVGRLQALGGATLTELAGDLDLAKSTVHNYLKTLETLGYVVNEDGRYRLGVRFLTHGIAAKRALGLRSLVSDNLSSIGEDIPYPTWWVCEELGRGIFLERAVPQEYEPVYGRMGKRSYLHTHAPGKAILARLSDKHVRQIVDRWGLPGRTERTTTGRNLLFDELDEIRERGIAVSDSEAILGVLSVGVNFQDSRGRTHAIGTFCFAREIHPSRAEEIGELLLDKVGIIESKLHRGE